jgi:hypothetical protein
VFHTIAYTANYAAPQTLANLPAITDTIITARSNDYIVTDDFRLGLAYGLGSTITELRFNWPSLLSYGFHEIYQYDYQGTTLPLPPDRPALVDYLSAPIKLPLDEQLDVQISNSPGTTEQDYLALWLFTPDHQFTVPSGLQRLTIRFTYAFTPGTANVWSGAQAITFTNTFKGGWYAIVGADVKDATSILFRFIFPKARLYQGRALRPGGICRTSLGNRPDPRFYGKLGTWGTFNSFETPSIEVLPSSTAAKAGVGALDVVYLGTGDPGVMP